MADSSEWEFEEEEQPARKKRFDTAGEASIAKLIEQGDANRHSSKQTVRNLKWGSGAPSTRRVQDLWVNRFKAFRKSISQGPEKPFTGDDVIRFFDSIIRKSTRADTSSELLPTLLTIVRTIEPRSLTNRSS